MEALAGVCVGLTPAIMEDLAAICLLVASVSRRVKAAAKAAGPGNDFSGHSGRVGLVHRMAGKGAPTVTGYELRVWDSIVRKPQLRFALGWAS